jgi:hypothetical protein
MISSRLKTRVLLLASTGWLLFSSALCSVSAILVEDEIVEDELIEDELDLSPPSVRMTQAAAAWLTVSKIEPLIGNHENCFVMASNKKAYLIGGRTYRNTCAYDPAKQTWDCTLEKPPILIHHMQCVAVNDEIYIPSAWTGDYPYETNVASIYIYKPSTNTWRTETGMASARLRGGAAAAYHNGFIYVSHGNRG